MASATPLIPASSVLLSRIIAGFGGSLKLLGDKRPQPDTDGLDARTRYPDDRAAVGWNRFSGVDWDIEADYPRQRQLDSFTSEQVELLVGETYRRYGFEVELSVARGAGDEGDLTLSRGSERILVRCRDWGVKRVGVERIKEFSNAIGARQADGGIFVTSGEFTREARTCAKGKALQLVKQEALAEAMEAVTCSGENLFVFGSWLNAFLEAAHFVDPTCPVCSSSMLLESIRDRASDRWICTMGPLCRGTREARTSVTEAMAMRAAGSAPF